jgi:hypothetical protein
MRSTVTLLLADPGQSIGYELQLADVVPATLDETDPEPLYDEEPEDPDEPVDVDEVEESELDDVAERTGWLVVDGVDLDEVELPDVDAWWEVETCELVAEAAGTAAAKPAVTAAPIPRAE